MELLSADNVCGRTLLSIVSSGSAIITELLRLSDHIPPAFVMPKNSNKPNARRSKYARVLFDFNYLKNPEDFDEKVDNSPELVDLDEEFRENHLAVLERFYQLFESIYRFVSDYQQFLEQLMEGDFVQHSLENLLLDTDGRQLMCEALHLYGVMLILLEKRIPGWSRERMIVSYYRYMGSAVVNDLDNVCKLARSSGAVPGQKKPANYPENVFSRFKLPREVIDMIIGRLRSDDIYNHTSAFPNPSHRSVALASQAGMLYVIMYFRPELLHKNTAVMREIVDKHFSDNWVTAFFMGYTVDLSTEWAQYPAAQAALNNILIKDNVVYHTERHVELVGECNTNLDKLLTEGVLVDEYVLGNVPKLLRTVRACNFTLRWFLLHRTTAIPKYRQYITQAVETKELMKLLTNTAEFEHLLKDILSTLIGDKNKRWEENKTDAAERMQELSEYFTGEKALTRVKKNENLQEWFATLKETILKLDIDNAIVAGRKISQLNNALDDVEDHHQIQSSLQVKQFLTETKLTLKKMVRTLNVSEKVQSYLDINSNFAYAWRVIREYTPMMHNMIKQDPSVVLLLKATFKKLSSILDQPLVRIMQIESKDRLSVAEYHSSELVQYVRSVLDIVPKSVFTVLDQIIKLKTHHLKALPTKMERKYLRDFAQFQSRHTLAKATHQVSVFTEGVLAMKATLVGIIRLDPNQLLEDGIRKELVRQIALCMNDFLVFKTGSLEDFELRLTRLGQKLDGFKQSFEYIQDYINMYGLKIWQEEFSRIIKYNVEQECNQFLKKKVFDWQSQYQSDSIPIPRFPPVLVPNQEPSVNFMGRLVRELLAQTSPRLTTYVECMQGWYDVNSTEVVGIRTFSLLSRAAGVLGLTGVDSLLCFMIVRDLSSFVQIYRRRITKVVSGFIGKITSELHPTSQFPANTKKLYAVASKKTSKIWPLLHDFVVKVGQAQLIRRQIANELNFVSKLDSKILHGSLAVLNDSLLNDVKQHYVRPEKHGYPGNPILPEVSEFLETSGINNPITKIYITTEPLEGIACIMFLYVLEQCNHLRWQSSLNTLVCDAKNSNLDGAPFVVGVITLMKQFHSSHTHTFLAYLGQFIRSNISAAASGQKVTTIPVPVRRVLSFLTEFCKFSGVSRQVIEAIVPAYILDRFMS